MSLLSLFASYRPMEVLCSIDVKPLSKALYR
jgi:hypothetical protein